MLHPRLLDWADVVTPSRRDLHTDHVAAAELVGQALRASAHAGAAHLCYLVHGAPIHPADALAPRHSLDLRERKRAALQCHTTQLLLSRRRLSALAARDELYTLAETDADAPPTRLRPLLRLLHLFMYRPPSVS